MTRKVITIITPCYNEELNVREVHRRVMAMAAELPEYRFEHLFADNASKDGTVAVLGYFGACGCSHQGCTGRDVEGEWASAAGANYVDQFGALLRSERNMQGTLAHHLDKAS